MKMLCMIPFTVLVRTAASLGSDVDLSTVADDAQHPDGEAHVQDHSELDSRRLWARFSTDDCVKQVRAPQETCIPCKKILPNGTEVNRFAHNCKRDATVLASQIFTPWHFCHDDGSCPQGRLPRWRGRKCWAFNRGKFYPYSGPAGVCVKEDESRHMPSVRYAESNMAHHSQGRNNVKDFIAAYQWSMETRAREYGPQKVMTCEKFCPGMLGCGEVGDCSCGEACFLRGDAVQSSDWPGSYPASNAIDSDLNSFSHTQEEKNPWWQLDLGSEKAIGIIRLRNRPGGCASRLFLGTGCDWEYNVSSYVGANQGAEIRVSSDSCSGDTCSGTICKKLVVPDQYNWYEADCKGVRGRYASVILPGEKRILHITGFTVQEATSAPPLTPSPAVQSGDTVFLKTHSGKYVDVDGGMVQARYGERGGWQALVIEKENGSDLHSGDKVYLKSHEGNHVHVSGSDVRSWWNDTGVWQSFVIEKKIGGGVILQGDHVCFRAHTNKHLDVEADIVQARYDDCSDWQLMRIQKEVTGCIMSGDLIHLEAHTGKLIDVEGRTVQARWSNPGAWETFSIKNKIGNAVLSGDTIFLKSHTGMMIDVEGVAVQARYDDTGAWQSLVIETTDGHDAISPNDNVYLSAHTGKRLEVEGTTVACRWAERGLWQSFTIQSSSSRRLEEVASDHSIPKFFV